MEISLRSALVIRLLQLIELRAHFLSRAFGRSSWLNLRICCAATSASKLLNIILLKSIFVFQDFSADFIFSLRKWETFPLKRTFWRFQFILENIFTSRLWKLYEVSCITSKMELFVNFLSISFKTSRVALAHSGVCCAVGGVWFCFFISLMSQSTRPRQFSQLLTLYT